MKVYLSETVLEAALKRIRWLFDEFPSVVVSTSGGKDSTVVLELALQVSAERGRLPLPVFWLDQECELAATVTYVREVMSRPEVAPYWFQVPFRLQNATSSRSLWLNAWGDGEQWVREKEPASFHRNVYGEDRFVRLMKAIIRAEFPSRTATLTGMRAEESKTRFMGTTHRATYKGETWGQCINTSTEHYLFHPIYDWTALDVWKAINDHGWDYNRHYDDLFRYGVPLHKMRVSNYHHETAVHSLFMLQEIEPETYARATQRISGLDAAAKMGADDYFVRDLPAMFRSWPEYRDYLLSHLIPEQHHREKFAQRFASMEERYPHEIGPSLYRLQVNSILANDVEMTKLTNWESGHFTKERLAEQKGYRDRITG